MSDGGDNNGGNGDGGYGGDSSDSSDSGSAWQPSRSSSAPDWGVLRRAMRWETFALLLFLVILAAVAS
ncbi:hypothetical protein ACH4TE_06415 [Streptomyces sioyaensis]|uniref:hypothetical protein n=1 Tax=Streptomyces sioyaensis TaxID=67364 RepID=UPI003799723A